MILLILFTSRFKSRTTFIKSLIPGFPLDVIWFRVKSWYISDEIVIEDTLTAVLEPQFSPEVGVEAVSLSGYIVVEMS